MPSASVENTTPFTTYTFKVQPENIVGKGPMSMPVSGQFNFNKAYGGDVPEGVEVPNYNGSGEVWRVHTFTNSGNLKVEMAPQKFRVLVVGGGGSHGSGNQERGPGGGGGGGFVDNENTTIPTGDHLVTVGTSGSGAASSLGSVLTVAGGGRGADGNTGGSKARGGTSGAPQSNQGGLNSSDSWSGGGGGGAGGNGGGAAPSAPGGGGPGLSSNITGANGTYGRGGNGGKHLPPRDMQHGAAGVVIIAYRTG